MIRPARQSPQPRPAPAMSAPLNRGTPAASVAGAFTSPAGGDGHPNHGSGNPFQNAPGRVGGCPDTSPPPPAIAQDHSGPAQDLPAAGPKPAAARLGRPADVGVRSATPHAESRPAGRPVHPAVDYLEGKLAADSRAVTAPRVASFREFLDTQARVPLRGGHHGPYTFAGREAMLEIVETIDQVLAGPLPDATISVCGGAQFGKTILELNLGAYVTGCQWLNWGFYLPDDDLVQGIVDTKLRPDVIDQIDWFAALTQVGKAVNKSGKAVNRKGAFSVTDGKRRASGMVIGLNKKPPTSFTFDVTTLDEVDDINEKNAEFVRGRMTSSPVRLHVKIGTQRVAGRGQHKAFKEGSQGVMLHKCGNCGHEQNLEEGFPQCIRLAIDGAPGTDPERPDPTLQWTGEFHHDGATQRSGDLYRHDPLNLYYLACVRCGHALDRSAAGFRWAHLAPDKIRLRHWSFRVSQLGIPAIDLSQIVADFQKAVADPDAMVAFRCDRLALPASTAQALSAELIQRARDVAPYDMPARVSPNCGGFAGLDTGRRCWFFARETESPEIKRVVHLEQIALGNVVDRTTALFHLLGIQTLFIDQNPATDEARTLALRLNGLEGLQHWPVKPDSKDAYISLPGGLTWNGHLKRWQNLRCAVVAFTRRKLGDGIRHSIDIFEKGGREVFVPLIECNRFETIDRVVRELLTPKENVTEVIFTPQGNRIRTDPALRLPRRQSGSPAVLDLLDSHLLAGSERETDKAGNMGDYADACENHFLLANAYSGLAELEGGRSQAAPFGYRPVELGEPRGRIGMRRIVL